MSPISIQLAQIANEILQKRTITPDLERKIDSLLWGNDFDKSEMHSLKRLEEVLANFTN